LRVLVAVVCGCCDGWITGCVAGRAWQKVLKIPLRRLVTMDKQIAMAERLISTLLALEAEEAAELEKVSERPSRRVLGVRPRALA
jgi:hypothetical protein